MERQNLKTTLLITIIGLLAISRVLPHPFNFSPVAAMGLFGAAWFAKKWIAYAAPLISLFISDLILNNTLYSNGSFRIFYEGFYWQYISFALVIFLATIVFRNNKFSFLKTGAAALGSSLIFFLISNFGVWASSSIYSADMSGLFSCYLFAIPFFQSTLAGDLIYSFILFGGFELLRKQSFSSSILVSAK